MEDIIGNAIMAIGGLALFLHGLGTTGETFRRGLSRPLRRSLRALAGRRWQSFLFGIVLSAGAQGSVTATAFAVGLVDIGLLPLASSLIVMMGASGGSTIVTFLLGLDLIRYAPLLLALSILAVRLGGPRIRRHAEIIKGISLVLTGMLILKSNMVPLTSSNHIRAIIAASAGNPLITGLFSFGLTSIVQSSPAVMALAIALASAEVLPAESIVAIVLGSHVGTAIPVLLSGLGTRRTALQLAWGTFFYKLIGTAAALPLSGLFIHIAREISPSPAFQVVILHLCIVWLNVLILLPLSSPLASLLQKIFPAGHAERLGDPLYLDHQLLHFPTMALTLLAKEMTRLGNSLEEFLHLLIHERGRYSTLSELERSTSNLMEHCIAYLAAIPTTGPNDYWRAEYASISYSLAAIRDMSTVMSKQLYPLMTAASCDLHEMIDQAPELQKHLRLLTRIVSLAVGTFALGGKQLREVSRETYEEYRESEKRARHLLRRGQYAIGSEGETCMWDLLTAGDILAKAAFELARGSLPE